MQGPVAFEAKTQKVQCYQPSARQLLRALEAMAGIGFCTLSTQSGKVHASEGLHALTGTLHLINQPVGFEIIESRTHPEDRGDLIENFHLLMRDTLPMRRDLRLVLDDGTVRHFDLRFERLIDEQSQAAGWIICVMDRSEQAGLRAQLGQVRQRLRAVLDQLDVDVAWFSSLDGRLVERVRQSEALGPARPSLFSLESWFNSVHPEDQAHVLAAMEGGEANITDVRVKITPDQYVPMRTIRKPVLDDKGEAVEWLGLSSMVQAGHGGLKSDAAAGEELLNGPLVRAARNLLGWTIPVLAEHSEVSASTIMRIEEASVPVIEVSRRRTAERLTRALTEGGVIFHRTLTGKLAISL